MSLSISEDGELQVQGYLRFAKLKRDQHVREVVSTVSEFKQEHIRQGEMYNFKELSNIFSELETEVKQLIDKEIQHAYHGNALLVKLLLSQAHAQGMELTVDTNALENEFLLKQISTSETKALSRPASDFIRRNRTLDRVATVSIHDQAAVKERDALKAELVTVQERMTKLQEETSKIMRDRSALNQQINSLKDELAAKDAALAAASADLDATKQQRDTAGRDAAAGRSTASATELEQLKKTAGGLGSKVAALTDELQAALNQLALKDKELRAASDAASGKLQDSKQFQQMRAMMQAKSQEVVALRKRLEKYEPQNVPSADTA